MNDLHGRRVHHRHIVVPLLKPRRLRKQHRHSVSLCIQQRRGCLLGLLACMFN